MSKYLPKGTAQRCLKIVEGFVGEGWEPALYPPGHEGEMWVVSLEGAGEWSIDLSNDDTVTWPDGVFVEPVASWCLGLYPSGN